MVDGNLPKVSHIVSLGVKKNFPRLMIVRGWWPGSFELVDKLEEAHQPFDLNRKSRTDASALLSSSGFCRSQI